MNTLYNTSISKTLAVLHKKAEADHLLRKKEREIAKQTGLEITHSSKTAYLAINKEEGDLLYLLANIIKAKNIVEFGCSHGISTIYLAAAAKDNKGKLITTDIEPFKVEAAKNNITDAGLNDYVSILLGDATQTLSDIENSIDFLFLDGAKELYLPIFNMLYPKLSRHAIVAADNTNNPETSNYVNYIKKLNKEFTSISVLDNRALISYRNSVL